MTGANRLLLGVGWATVIFLFAWKRGGPRKIVVTAARSTWRFLRRRDPDPEEPLLTLPGGVGLEIGILLVASVYSFVIVAKGRLAIEDTIVPRVAVLVVRPPTDPFTGPETQTRRTGGKDWQPAHPPAARHRVRDHRLFGPRDCEVGPSRLSTASNRSAATSASASSSSSNGSHRSRRSRPSSWPRSTSFGEAPPASVSTC